MDGIKSACERLIHEKDQLIQYADAVAARLGYFDELEAIATEFHRLNNRQDNTNVMPLLTRLDECLAYMASNPQYVDTMTYTLRLQQLQGRALGLIKSKVQQVLQRAVAAVREEHNRYLASSATLPDPAAAADTISRSGSLDRKSVV